MTAGTALILETSPDDAKEFAEKFKAGEYKITAVKQKRSLDANAYFHVLVGEIASKLRAGFEETKRNLNLDYGTVATDDTGAVIGFKMLSAIDPAKFYKYTRAIGHKTENKKQFTCYLLYKRTSELDSKEFSRLIEGTVTEARELGIETLRDEEINELIKYMEQRQ
ncbi:MAG: hypothetical protein LBT88_08125 [Oscillospiraceae bacterium]|jgi:hypothetical protein|nr:hypothetical protein [Oscillospiraceae bacterium]